MELLQQQIEFLQIKLEESEYREQNLKQLNSSLMQKLVNSEETNTSTIDVHVSNEI